MTRVPYRGYIIAGRPYVEKAIGYGTATYVYLSFEHAQLAWESLGENRKYYQIYDVLIQIDENKKLGKYEEMNDDN